MSLDGSISQAMPPAGNGTPGYLTDQARGCRFNGWFWLHGHLIGTGFRHRLTLHGRLRGSLDEPQQRRDLGNGEVHRRQRPQRETLGAHCPGGLARKRRSRLRHHPAALGANLPDQRCQILDLQPCPRHGDRHAAASPCRGNLLADGDSVVTIKDLKVKGAGQTLRRGTVIKSIRLTGDPQEIDCRYEGIKGLVLRAEFVRKH